VASEWYQLASTTEPLSQGDIFRQLPILELLDEEVSLDASNTTVDVDVVEKDVVLMTQSCDLQPGRIKVDYVQLCPVYELAIFIKGKTEFKNRNKLSDLLNGKYPRFSVLASTEISAYPSEPLVVDLSRIYAVRVGYLDNFCRKYPEKLQLISPYREYLAQNFARLFMRVGLPSDISETTKKILTDKYAPKKAN